MWHQVNNHCQYDLHAYKRYNFDLRTYHWFSYEIVWQVGGKTWSSRWRWLTHTFLTVVLTRAWYSNIQLNIIGDVFALQETRFISDKDRVSISRSSCFNAMSLIDNTQKIKTKFTRKISFLIYKIARCIFE